MDQGKLTLIFEAPPSSKLQSNSNKRQGLLAVPFVLNSQPAVEYDEKHAHSLDTMARSARQRYAEIFRDVEDLILDHSELRPQRGGHSFTGHISQSPRNLNAVEAQYAGSHDLNLLHPAGP